MKNYNQLKDEETIEATTRNVPGTLREKKVSVIMEQVSEAALFAKVERSEDLRDQIISVGSERQIKYTLEIQRMNEKGNKLFTSEDIELLHNSKIFAEYHEIEDDLEFISLNDIVN